MSDENNTETETPPAFTMSESDYDAIADRVHEKSQQKKEEKKTEPTPSPPAQTQTEIKLTDEDRKGIASYLREMDKLEAEETAKLAEEDKKKKQEQKDDIPQAPANLFERRLFGIGGGKRAS